MVNIIAFGGPCIECDGTSGFSTRESYMNLCLGMKEFESVFRIYDL
jgi:hypothetical protein